MDLVINGHGVFSVCLQDKYAKKMIPLSDEEICAQVKEELGNIVKIPKTRLNDIRSLHLQRWECATPKFSPHFVKRVRSFLDHPEGQGGQNVYFCGDYLNAPFVEGAIRSGKEAAKRICEK